MDNEVGEGENVKNEEGFDGTCGLDGGRRPERVMNELEQTQRNGEGRGRAASKSKTQATHLFICRCTAFRSGAKTAAAPM